MNSEKIVLYAQPSSTPYRIPNWNPARCKVHPVKENLNVEESLEIKGTIRKI
jgi:hypothetical protein